MPLLNNYGVRTWCTEGRVNEDDIFGSGGLSPKTTPTFKGKPSLKAFVLARLRQHLAADTLMQGLGVYYRNTRDEGKQGCWLGCITRNRHYTHLQAAKRFGLPEAITHIAEFLFERLPCKVGIIIPTTDGYPNYSPYPVMAESASGKFSVDIIEAIPVGVDLETAYWQYIYWLLTDPEYGYITILGICNPRTKWGEYLWFLASYCERLGRGETLRFQYEREFMDTAEVVRRLSMQDLTITEGGTLEYDTPDCIKRNVGSMYVGIMCNDYSIGASIMSMLDMLTREESYLNYLPRAQDTWYNPLGVGGCLVQAYADKFLEVIRSAGDGVKTEDVTGWREE